MISLLFKTSLFCICCSISHRCSYGVSGHVADGIQFVRDINNSLAADEASVVDRNDDASSDTKSPPLSGSCNASNAENGVSTKIDVLIIDVDSSYSRGMQIVNSILFVVCVALE